MLTRIIHTFQIGIADKMFNASVTEHSNSDGTLSHYSSECKEMGIFCVSETYENVIADLRRCSIIWFSTATEQDIDDILAKRLNDRRYAGENSGTT